MVAPVEHLIEYIPIQQSNSLHNQNPFMANPISGLPSFDTDMNWEMLYNGLFALI